MDLDRTEEEEEEEEEEESPLPAKKIRKLQNDEEDDGTGVSEDHSTGTSSSATVAVNQRDDTAMSSSGYGSSTDDNCSALPMPRSFTPVGGTPTGPLPTTYPLPNPLHQPFHVPLLWPHPTSQTSQQLLSSHIAPQEASIGPLPTAHSLQYQPHPLFYQPQLWPHPSAQTSQLLAGPFLQASWGAPGHSRISALAAPPAPPPALQTMVAPTPTRQQYAAVSDSPGPSQQALSSVTALPPPPAPPPSAVVPHTQLEFPPSTESSSPSQQVMVQQQGLHPTPQPYPTPRQDTSDIPGPSWWTPPMFAGKRHERQWREEETNPPQRKRVEEEQEGGLDGGFTTIRRAEDSSLRQTPGSFHSGVEMEVDNKAVASPTQGSFFPEGHETFIAKSCFVVGGVQSLLISSEAHIITFGPGKEGSAKLLIPKGAIPRGQELRVRYAYLLDGPFSIPKNYDIVSPVLYIDYNTSHVKKPLELQLHHWYAGNDRQKNMTFLKAPHIAHKGGVFPFTKYSHGSFSDEEQFASLNLEEDLCCVVVAVKKTGNLPHPANYRLHLLNKVQTCVRTSFRLYVTYDHSAWTEVVTLCIVESQGWTREGYAPPQLVTFKVPDDGVRAEFIPSKGHGWQIFGQGKQTVQQHEVWQPVQKEYQVQMQQQSSVFSRVLSWLPWEPQQCNLRLQIDQQMYPPSIHMDLMYDDPFEKPEINTTLNISYLCSKGDMPFRVKIEGAHPHTSCGAPGPSGNTPSLPPPAAPPMSSMASHVSSPQPFTASHKAEQVLDLFRDRFIAEVNAQSVVMDLLHSQIIPRDAVVTISQTNSPEEQNASLHYCLKQTCTVDALKSACQIISAVKGNPRMVALGRDMLRYLESEAQHLVTGDTPGPSGITTAPPSPPTSTESPLPLPPRHSAQAPSRRRSASPLTSEPHSSKRDRRGGGGGRGRR